jgi:predicted esterase
MGQAFLFARGLLRHVLCGALALTVVRADEPRSGPRIEPYAISPELGARMKPYRLKAYTFTAEDGTDMSFLLAGPEAKARPGERYPLILFLHGLGEHGPGLERVFHQPHIFELSKPESQQRNPCYIVAPQHPKGGHWWAPSFTCPHECAATAMALLQEVVRRAQPPVDPNRIYITGLSSGGRGAMDFVRKFPGVFAACVPISCSAWMEGITEKNVTRYWYMYNRNDTVGQELGVRLAERFARHVASVGGEFRIGQYDRSGHDAWSQAYREPLLWKWLFAQRLDRPLAQESVFAEDKVRSGLTASASIPGRVGSEPARAADGLLTTAYVSDRNAVAGAFLEVRFAQGLAMGPFVILTGDAHGRHALSEGSIEVSYDGQTFRRLMAAQGARTSARVRQPVRALRVTAGPRHRGPLCVREILIGDEAAETSR